MLSHNGKYRILGNVDKYNDLFFLFSSPRDTNNASFISGHSNARGSAKQNSPFVAAVPAAFDWRTSGKDQGECGSCWAFTAIGN
jgi:C1A family cysteine protease